MEIVINKAKSLSLRLILGKFTLSFYQSGLWLDNHYDIFNSKFMDEKTLQKQPASPFSFIIGIFVLIIGVVLGFLLYKSFPANNVTKQPVVAKDQSEIDLPADAVQIQKCANRKGTLYVKTKDIPAGPVYMVNEGKVIGLEFMLSQEEFIKGKSYDSLLAGLGMKIDHVNIGFLSNGHEGYTQPHYHMDLYRVTPEQEKDIKCPTVPSTAATTSGKLLDFKSATSSGKK